MKYAVQQKYHLVALGLILLLFVFSVQLRKENMALPLSRHHEWLTAHTLITCDIWKENGGPSNYQFNPVYTYPGDGNERRKMLGGIVDENGDVYYVSYPPFAFYVAYYATQLTGGPDLNSIHHLSLAIHLLCAIFIYLLAVALSADKERHYFSIAGLCGAFLYLFSAGNLWFHGNLYFVDMVVQLFVIAGLFFTVRFVKKDYQREMVQLSILFFVFFLAVYTEWLGLFVAFFTGIALFVGWLMTREARFMKAFFTVGVAATFALLLTVWQYSFVAGWEMLKKVSTEKYDERSGHGTLEETPNQFNIESDAAFDFIVSRIDSNYKMAENFVGIAAIIFVFVVLFRRTRQQLVPFQWHSVVVCIMALSILMHYYLFFNFNALHDFSSVKTGFLMVLLVVVFLSLTESMFSLVFKRILFVLIAILAVDKGIESVNKYYELYPVSTVDWDRVRTAEAIREHSRPNAGVFLNIPPNPELVYSARHNVFPVKDTSELKTFMAFFDNTEGQYYHHINAKLDYILEFTRNPETNELTFTNKVNMDGNSTSGDRHFQK